MMITPLIGTAQACRWRKSRTVETFTTTPFADPSTLTDMEELVPATVKYVCDGTIKISWGTVRKFNYNGALGTGAFYRETLINIIHVSGGKIELPPGSGNYEDAIGQGSGIYKFTLEIEDGPYGTGTLKGIGRTKSDWDFTVFRFETWDTARLRPVTGDLDIIKVYFEGYNTFPAGYWWTTTTIVS